MIAHRLALVAAAAAMLAGVAGCTGGGAADAAGDTPTADVGTRDGSNDVASGPDVAAMDARTSDAAVDGATDAPAMDRVTTDGAMTDSAPADGAAPMDGAAPVDAGDGGSAAGRARPIAPLSTSTVTSRRPTLRWALADGATAARVEVCADRACTRVLATLRGTTSAAPAADLPPGVVFWRAFAVRDAAESATPSATWQFRVGARTAPVDTSYGTTLDVNGDGYADIAVGAYGADPGGRSSAGTVTVYLGSAAGVVTAPHRVLEGAAADSFFGVSVASAGDINGDGYADLAVGASDASPGGRASAGTVSVFLGGAAGLAATPLVVLEGTAAHDEFGTSVAGAGDIDGDGYADLIVGAESASPGGRLVAGTATVYFGSAAGFTASVRVLEGDVSGDRFGHSVASAGDVNGDGYADVLVGALRASPGGRFEAGVAKLYLGSAAGLATTPPWVFEGADAHDALGAAVAGAGDVNGDGYTDVLIGAPVASPGGRSMAGTTSVFLGSASGLAAAPDRVLEGVASEDEFGISLAGAGDVNGDGFADVVIAAFHADPAGRSNAGAASVFLGSASGLAAAPDRVLEGVAPGDEFGTAVASDDIDDDGHSDVIVGAQFGDTAGAFSVGTTTVYLGSAAGLTAAPHVVLAGGAILDFSGSALACTAPARRARSARASRARA